MQWSEIRHHEKGNVVLHKFASANLHLQAPAYWLNQYHGDWAKEMIFLSKAFHASELERRLQPDGSIMHKKLNWRLDHNDG